jgi:hypothetical protein
MVTVVETVTASWMVPATSMVSPEPARESAWVTVAQGEAAVHGLESLPLADTNSEVAALAV